MRAKAFVIVVTAMIVLCPLRAQDKPEKVEPSEELAALLKEIGDARKELKDPYSEAQILLKLKDHDEPAVVDYLTKRVLAPSKKRSTFIIRLTATELLGKLRKEESVEQIAYHLAKDPNWVVKCGCATALGMIGNPKGADALVSGLKYHVSDVRAASARALGNMHSVEAVQPLIDALERKNKDIFPYVTEALVRSTGVDLGGNKERWQEWWDANKETCKMLPVLDKPPRPAEPEYPVTCDFHFENRVNSSKRKVALRKYGGSKVTEALKDHALDWLSRHQDEDGRWACRDFHKHCPTHPGEGGIPVIDPKWAVGNNTNPWGCGNAGYDVGVTGLALMAFLGDGQTHRHGDYKEVIDKGIGFLIGTQQANGQFPGTMYHQGIATHALVEAYGLTHDPAVGEAAQKGVDFICYAQKPEAAWRYVPRSPISDMSVSSWQCMALQAAHRTGLIVQAQNLIWAKRWIDFQTAFSAAEDLSQFVQPDVKPVKPSRRRRSKRTKKREETKEFGEVYYSDQMEGGKRVSPSGTPANTAAAILVRIFQGALPGDRLILAGSAYVTRPDHLPRFGRPNVYAWFYGSQAMFQVGGYHWDAWNESLVRAMTELGDVDAKGNMTRTDCERGSLYHPNDSWVARIHPDTKKPHGGGRVMNTALGVLCLETYYFYPVIENE